MEHKKRRFPKKTSIYKYYPTRDNKLACIVCGYNYEKDAPLSTLQKHLRVKHNFSIRKPLSPQTLKSQMYEFQGKENTFTQSSVSQQVAASEKFEEALASWIVNNRISSSVVASPSFQNLFRFFDHNIILPSPEQIDKRIHQNEKLSNTNLNELNDRRVYDIQLTTNSPHLNSRTSNIASPMEIEADSSPSTSKFRSIPIHSLLSSEENRNNYFKQDLQHDSSQTLQKALTFQTPCIVHSSLLN